MIQCMEHQGQGFVLYLNFRIEMVIIFDKLEHYILFLHLFSPEAEWQAISPLPQVI